MSLEIGSRCPAHKDFGAQNSFLSIDVHVPVQGSIGKLAKLRPIGGLMLLASEGVGPRSISQSISSKASNNSKQQSQEIRAFRVTLFAKTFVCKNVCLQKRLFVCLFPRFHYLRTIPDYIFWNTLDHCSSPAQVKEHLRQQMAQRGGCNCQQWAPGC